MGFESKIFISAEHVTMSSSNPSSSGGQAASLRSSKPPAVILLPNAEGRDPTIPVVMESRDSSSGGAARSLADSREPSPHGNGEATGVTFGKNFVHEFDPSDAVDEEQGSPLADESDANDRALPEITPVVVPEGVNPSQALIHLICIVNIAIIAINGFIARTTSLDAHQIAQSLRNLVRFQTKDNGRHVAQFLKRTLKKFKNLAESFDAKHPANIVTLMSLGYDEQTANSILDFLNGRSLKPVDDRVKTRPYDRLCWFWIFINLRMRTQMFNHADGLKAFFLHATNPIGCSLPQDCQQVASEAYSQFNSQVPKSGTGGVKGQRQPHGSSSASVAGSDFTTMTQIGGFLWKYHAAFTAASKLLNEWLSGNDHLRNGRTELSEEALIALVYRLFVKMQCSKTGDFGTDRAYSSYIYTKLMDAYWRAQNSGKRFVARLLETFSSILCATGNYDAAIEWLNRALQCKHPKKGELTDDEVAVLNFAFISMSLGVQSLASCTSENLGALFAHIFDGDDLEVDESDAHKFQSAIERVAEDFATEPKVEATQVPSPVPSEVQSGLRSRGGQPRGRGGAVVGGSHAVHHASEEARNTEFEEMMRKVAANPEKQAAMMKWLAESKQ
jgi:hypothetical protein